MRVEGFRSSQTSLRLRFTWFTCWNIEGCGPKTQRYISTLSFLLAFILTLSVTLHYPSLFFLLLFYLDDRLENPLCAFFLLLLHAFGRTKQRQIPFWYISVGFLKSTGRASMGLTLGPQQQGLQEAVMPRWHSGVLALLVHGWFPLLCATDTLVPWQGTFRALDFCLGKLMTQYLPKNYVERFNSFRGWLPCFCGAERSKIQVQL